MIAPARNNLEPLIDHAETLCRLIAPDLQGHPLYIVPIGTLPAEEFGQSAGCLAFTTPYLDLYVKDHVAWRGRGPAMVLSERQIADRVRHNQQAFRDEVLATIVHEAAHWLERKQLYLEAEHKTPERIKTEANITFSGADEVESRPVPARYWHDDTFIRVCAHLSYRATRLGLEVPLASLACGRAYGQYPAGAYLRALGDEPAQMINESFAEIRATAAPEPFTELWRRDTATA
jgi:hypothetical protein